ncbi:MAG: hypothetical protein ACM3ZC_11375 [Bacteroidota bacterium]
MKEKRMRGDRDPFGSFLAVVLLLLLTGLIAAQTALSDPAWRARYSLVDILEGTRLQDY